VEAYMNTEQDRPWFEETNGNEILQELLSVQQEVEKRLKNIERALGIVDENDLKILLAEQDFYPDKVKEEIEESVRKGLLNEPLTLTPDIPGGYGFRGTGWEREYGFLDGRSKMNVSKDENGIINIYFTKYEEEEGALVGLGWEPRFLQGPMLSTRYKYPQLFFVPLVSNELEHKGSTIVAHDGSINVGPAPAGAKIYRPKSPWPPSSLEGDVVKDALRESIKRTTEWSSRTNWRVFYENNENILPANTKKFLEPILIEERIL
jgi:hypothetical protein